MVPPEEGRESIAAWIPPLLGEIVEIESGWSLLSEPTAEDTLKRSNPVVPNVFEMLLWINCARRGAVVR
jgi:hypothetical protein